jgi:TRAP-type C4-dicarboxylate transport system permease small subunit
LKGLVRLYDGLIGALAYLAGVAIVLIFVLIVVDVTARELFGSSLNYTIGVVEYAMLYFTMFAAPYLVRTRGHVYIEALISLLPAQVRRYLEIAVYVISAGATLVFAYFSMVLLMENIVSGVIDIRGIDFPGWLIVVPLPVCYGLVAVEFLRFLFGPESMYRSDGSHGDAL